MATASPWEHTNKATKDVMSALNAISGVAMQAGISIKEAGAVWGKIAQFGRSEGEVIVPALKPNEIDSKHHWAILRARGLQGHSYVNTMHVSELGHFSGIPIIVSEDIRPGTLVTIDAKGKAVKMEGIT